MSVMKVNNTAADEYKQLREERPFVPISFTNAQVETLTLTTLINVCLLNNHGNDVVSTPY